MTNDRVKYGRGDEHGVGRACRGGPVRHEEAEADVREHAC
jgi:hypothetical protein